MSDPLIISVATTGSWPTKTQNPSLPTTEEEIATAALACHRAGAAIVHIHVRNDEGRVTCDPRRYAKVRQLVASAGSDVIINMSTGGGAGLVTDAERIEPVTLGPEIASFDCGSLNFGDGVFINSPAFLRELAALMRTHSVLPEIECFEPGHVWNALRLIDDGVLSPPYWFQFVLGVRGGSPATVKQLVHLVEMLPRGRSGPCAPSGGRNFRSTSPRLRWAVTSAPDWKTTSTTTRANSPPTSSLSLGWLGSRRKPDAMSPPRPKPGSSSD